MNKHKYLKIAGQIISGSSFNYNMGHKNGLKYFSVCFAIPFYVQAYQPKNLTCLKLDIFVHFGVVPNPYGKK